MFWGGLRVGGEGEGVVRYHVSLHHTLLQLNLTAAEFVPKCFYCMILWAIPKFHALTVLIINRQSYILTIYYVSTLYLLSIFWLHSTISKLTTLTTSAYRRKKNRYVQLYFWINTEPNVLILICIAHIYLSVFPPFQQNSLVSRPILVLTIFSDLAIIDY